MRMLKNMQPNSTMKMIVYSLLESLHLFIRRDDSHQNYFFSLSCDMRRKQLHMYNGSQSFDP